MNDEGHAFSGLGSLLYIAQLLKKIMHRPFPSRDEWVDAILGPPLTPTLQWDDYAHLAPSRELAVDIVSGAAAGRAVGVNLLLHGPVGTGSVEITRFRAGPAIIQAMTAGNAPGHHFRRHAGNISAVCYLRRWLILDDLLIPKLEFGKSKLRSRGICLRVGGPSRHMGISAWRECEDQPFIWTQRDLGSDGFMVALVEKSR
jgi:hypothetical protein